MGSFNIKCFASGQVIAEREKCRVAVILQEATFYPVQMTFRDKEYALYGISHAGSGPDALWAPMTCFMSGTYTDGSKVTLDETPENQAILAEFFNGLYRQAATTLAREEGGHRRDMPFDFKALVQETAPKLHAELSKQKHFFESLAPDALDLDEAIELWDTLQDAVICNRVFCADGSQVLRPLKLATVHEVTFHRLIALVEDIKFYDGGSYAREDYFTSAFNHLAEELADVEDEGKRFVRKDIFRDSLRLRMTSKLSNSLLWAFRRTFEAGVDAVVDAGKPVTHFLETCKAPLDALYALKGIDVLDVQFTPIAYAGQDYDNATGKRYSDFVAGASTEICAARKARFGEVE